jgi:acyl dehydratase
MRTFQNLAELAACVGQTLATSEWHTVTQAQINTFADATGDHQWIHVDPVRAAAGPFGTTIAHGFLTLSLVAKFSDDTLQMPSAKMGVNYGLNKVRFITPVPAGSRIRAHFKLLEAQPLPAPSAALTGGLQTTVEVTIELENHPKPACVAESLTRRFE